MHRSSIQWPHRTETPSKVLVASCAEPGERVVPCALASICGVIKRNKMATSGGWRAMRAPEVRQESGVNRDRSERLLCGLFMVGRQSKLGRRVLGTCRRYAFAKLPNNHCLRCVLIFAF